MLANMVTDTRQKILDYITKHSQVRVADLGHFLAISNQALHKQLHTLIESGVLQKIGKPPKVFYVLSSVSFIPISGKQEPALDYATVRYLKDNFINITPDGRKLDGIEGFAEWCKKRQLPIVKTASEYQATLSRYHALRKGGLLDGSRKIAATFGEVLIDELFYLDFYSIERFGKTKLGQLVLYAKQSQDRAIIKQLLNEVIPPIARFIKERKFSAIGFISPSVKRQVQLMKEIERSANFGLPILRIEKIATQIRVPQKSLSKLEDRVENARATFVATDKNSYDNVILIDDAVGSGATMNEIARKLKEKGIAKIVTGLALVGSYKGFDVISEV